MINRCLGGLKGVKSEVLHCKVVEILPEVKGRPRLFGYDIELESPELEFYINTYDEKEYQIDISTRDEGVFFNILEKLRDILVELKADFDLVYFIEDEEGSQMTTDKVFFTNLI